MILCISTNINHSIDGFTEPEACSKPSDGALEAYHQICSREFKKRINNNVSAPQFKVRLNSLYSALHRPTVYTW
jgi:hypothetical protein